MILRGAFRFLGYRGYVFVILYGEVSYDYFFIKMIRFREIIVFSNKSFKVLILFMFKIFFLCR